MPGTTGNVGVGAGATATGTGALRPPGACHGRASGSPPFRALSSGRTAAASPVNRILEAPGVTEPGPVLWRPLTAWPFRTTEPRLRLNAAYD